MMVHVPSFAQPTLHVTPEKPLGWRRSFLGDAFLALTTTSSTSSSSSPFGEVGLTQVALRCDCSGLATWWRPVARARAFLVLRRKTGMACCLEAFFLKTDTRPSTPRGCPFACEFVWLPRRRRVRLRLPDGVECVCGERLGALRVISLGSLPPDYFKQRDALCWRL